MRRFLAVTLSLLLCTNTAAESEMTLTTAAALDKAVDEGRFKQITSVLVMRNGATIYERYWAEGGVNVLNDTRSAMKSLTAMAVGAAIDDGYIDSVDARAVEFFPNERPFRHASVQKDAITIRDLLTMTSALHCNDNDADSPGNENNMHQTEQWLRFVLDLPAKPAYSRDERGYGPFSYCTAGSFLLGQIVERAVGRAVDVYISDRILEPLGIKRINWFHSPSGEIQTGGGAELRTQDLARLAEMVRNDGTYAGRAILSPAWVAAMTRAHVSANERQDYGFQWWRRDYACGEEPLGVWYMAGNGGNKVAVIDSLGMSVVVTSTLYGTRGMHEQTNRIIEDFVLPGVPGCAG